MMHMIPASRKLHDIYEINTATYLRKLSHESGEPVTLETIPEKELARISTFGCDAVWLMGIWERSPMAVEMGLKDTSLLNEISEVLPDFTPTDMIGSAYSISAYQVNADFGGEVALAALRERLSQHGLKLLLDFVPNHSAFDHEWTTSHPEYYIQGTIWNRLRHPSWYLKRGNTFIAKGRDPHFAPWPDVAQLNAFATEYRNASIDTLTHIASLCDGVRCDMAMLMTNDIFAQTWGRKAGAVPTIEYWQEVITHVRDQHEDFVFIAECYWDMQAILVNQGFDYCYDKDIYDHLVEGDMEAAHARVAEQSPIAEHLVHFLENHDEPRAARVFDLESHRAALHYITSLPGPRLWHDGQFEGYRTKVPVHIGRGPNEPTDSHIADMYRDALYHASS